MIIQNIEIIPKNDPFREVILELAKVLSDEYVITVDPLTVECPQRGKVEVDNSKINILLGMWDEYDSKFHRTLFNKFDYIFNQYIQEEEENRYENLFSLPLLYNSSIIRDCEHKRPIGKVSTRPVDVFFSGHLSSKNRYESMANNIEYLKTDVRSKKYKFDFNQTGGFMMGFGSDEYYDRLYRSKIAFCPPGNISNETYRFYEAMMCGCIVVCPYMPKTKIYQNLPVIEVEDFKNNAADVVLNLLEDVEKLQEIQDKIVSYWDDHYSNEKVAKYIISRLKTIL